MRRLILCTLALLGLPHFAVADAVTGSAAGQILAEAEVASGGSASRVLEFPPVLDLRIRGRHVLTDPDRPIDPDLLGAEGLERYDAAGREAADEGLSFGFEVKRRPQFENRMRPDENETPGLQDDFERLIEHSTLGVRGTYRF